jgi:hypothetical protein
MFHGLCRTSQLDESLPARFDRIHSGAHIIFSMHGNMGFEFFHKFTVTAPHSQQPGQTQ